MATDPDDYYGRLGVRADADDETLRAAWRRLARLLHPDVPGTGDAAAFIRLQVAWEVLSDPVLRREYDLRVREPRHGASPGPTAGRPRRPRPEPTNAASADAPPGAPYQGPWAGGVDTVKMELVLSPDEAAAGGRVTVMVSAPALCPGCGGLGENVLTGACPACGGTGTRKRTTPVELDLGRPAVDGAVLEVPLGGAGRPRSRLLLRVVVKGV